MVHTSIAAPSLSLAQLESVSRELTQHKHILQQRRVNDVDLEITEIATTSAVYRGKAHKDDPSTQPQGRNKSFKEIPASIVTDSVPHSITGFSSLNFESIPEMSDPNLVQKPNTVSEKESFDDRSTSVPSSDTTQSLDIFSISRLAIRTSTFFLNINKTTLISSHSSSISTPCNTSIKVPTSSKFAFASLIESTAGSFTSGPSLIATNLTPFSPIEISSSPTPSPDSGRNEETTASSNSAASPTKGSEHSSHEPNITAAVVGGVIGSIASVALIILLILLLLRRHKNNKIMLLFGNSTGTISSNPGTSPGQNFSEISQRQPLSHYVSAALSTFTKNKKSHKSADTYSTRDNEKGFYRVSGRKLPSVISHGGDGYGGFTEEPNSQSVSSLCYDSRLFRGESPNPSNSTHSFSATQPINGMSIIHSSPQNLVADEGLSVHSKNQLRRPDALGRSRPSLDASHTSRFTEEI